MVEVLDLKHTALGEKLVDKCLISKIQLLNIQVEMTFLFKIYNNKLLEIVNNI